jgi:hypothetical protein
MKTKGSEAEYNTLVYKKCFVSHFELGVMGFCSIIISKLATE